MKIVEKEKVEKYNMYVAFDGTVFRTQEECQKYETSAVGVILSKILDFGKKIGSVEILDECDGNDYIFVVPKKQAHIDALNHLMLLPRSANNYDPIFTKESIGVPYIIGYRLDGNILDWSWAYNVNKFIKDISSDTFIVEEK